jgi:hypothetical protein
MQLVTISSTPGGTGVGILQPTTTTGGATNVGTTTYPSLVNGIPVATAVANLENPHSVQAMRVHYQQAIQEQKQQQQQQQQQQLQQQPQVRSLDRKTITRLGIYGCFILACANHFLSIVDFRTLCVSLTLLSNSSDWYSNLVPLRHFLNNVCFS